MAARFNLGQLFLHIIVYVLLIFLWYTTISATAQTGRANRASRTECCFIITVDRLIRAARII